MTAYQVNNENDIPAGFFLFTSNADAHSYDFFPAHEIHDCHGNVEIWQCHHRECCNEHSGLWRVPLEFSFVVCQTTMLGTRVALALDDTTTTTTTTNHHAEDSEATTTNFATAGHTKGSGQPRRYLLRYMPSSLDTKGWLEQPPESANWPRCGHRHSLARPAIFMFDDGFEWNNDDSQEIRWDYWKESLVELAKAENEDDGDSIGEDLKVCVLEIGCGVRVPTCRTWTETLVEELLQTERCSNGVTSTSVHLIRINPDFPHMGDDSIPDRNFIPIMARGLEALQKIDVIYQKLKAKETN